MPRSQLAIQETGKAAASQGHWLAIVYAAIQVISWSPIEAIDAADVLLVPQFDKILKVM
jgi:hypothetical protein